MTAKKQKVKKLRCRCGHVIDSEKCRMAHFNPMNRSANINPFRYQR